MKDSTASHITGILWLMTALLSHLIGCPMFVTLALAGKAGIDLTCALVFGIQDWRADRARNRELEAQLERLGKIPAATTTYEHGSPPYRRVWRQISATRWNYMIGDTVLGGVQQRITGEWHWWLTNQPLREGTTHENLITAKQALMQAWHDRQSQSQLSASAA